MAALTKMRSTIGSLADALMICVCVDVHAIGGNHHGRRHLLALAPGELAIGHRREPDVSVEANLMAGVAGEHRAAARLRQVADEEPAPADLGSLVGKPFEELHQVRMAPV